MVRERAVAYSSREESSSRSSAEETSTSSSSPSSTSSSSSSSRGADARHNRRRLKSRHTSTRHSAKKRKKQEDTSRERGKKRKKISFAMDAHTKSEEKRRKRKSKRIKLSTPMETIEQRSPSKERKSNKLSECQEDTKSRSYNSLEEAMNLQEQQKALIRQNAERAKARLESGELQRARDEQKKMHQLYGTVDWRATKKLRTEKKMLERTVAAGKRLASLEQREYARMDAFRVALGLPTAEAQRQAEWRREATQALLDLENDSKHTGPPASHRCKKSKNGVIGPMLPP